ncbi:MAG: hypothetical protein IVW56_08655 [Candidatus Binataceae bacterium]|nr:hypothetical protein [Candidatus Binataceae bacterium]
MEEPRIDQGGKMQEKETLDERLPALFEPDTLLPIQYFEAMRKKHLLEGEKRLILSVLEDAIECFMKCIDSPTNKGQRLFRDADEWISLEDTHWVFSFDNVCDMLDINPQYMRRGLRNWKERKLAAMQLVAAAKAEAQVRAEADAAAGIVAEPIAAAEPVIHAQAPKTAEADKAIAPVKPAPHVGKPFTPRVIARKGVVAAPPRTGSRTLRKARA